MVPVIQAVEPKDFNNKVRVPGNNFLLKNPNPTSSEWKGKEYWQLCLPQMRKSYNGLCAYSAQWIPHGTGAHSIDHFYPKIPNYSLAYEWSNFRYVSSRFNSRKGSRTVIDPFVVKHNWFSLNFSNFFIERSNLTNHLSAFKQKEIENTIEYLKLNEDEQLVEERFQYYISLIKGDISYNFLKNNAPFIAYEVDRQKKYVVV